VEDGAERPDGVARWGRVAGRRGGCLACAAAGCLASAALRVAWRSRRCGLLGVRAAGHRSPRVLLVAFGNEGEDPGACCALSRATCRRARVFRNTLAGDWPNWVGLGPVSDPNPTQFANCAGSASVSAANPAQFANCPGSLSVSERNPGRFASRARTRRQSLLAILPHCQNATTKPSGERRPLARTRAARRRGRRRRPGGADTDRPPRRARQACPVSRTRSRRTPPDRAVAASRPRRARRAGGTSRLWTTGARRRRSSPCRR
jgi:hypothetical protein